MKVKSNFGNIISEARKKKRLTQQELATKIFVTDKAISNWENGKNIPDEDILKRLEEVLEVEIVEKKQINKVKIIVPSIIIIILLIFLAILLTYTLNNYNKFRIYEINLNSSSFTLEWSNIIVTSEEIFINTSELKNNNLPYQPQYSVELFYKDERNEKMLLSSKKSYNYFHTQLKNSKSIQNDLLNNLYLKIDYIDYKGNELSETLKLNLSRIVSNNKISYNESENTNINNELINLLVNNSYHKINDNEYEKEYKDDYYKFNIFTKELYYEGKKENVNLYAIKKENGNCYYAILESNKIIEYSLYNDVNGKKYNEIIKSKMNEINKLIIN